MFQVGTSIKSRRPRKQNYFWAGSERMLKAHHKNAVIHKTLDDKKNAFDATCHKKISKVQHEIYDVYFNEFVPLREEAVAIQQQLPDIHPFGNPRIKKLATIPGNGRRVATRLPSIYSRAIASSDSDKRPSVNGHKRTEAFLRQLRQQELERQKENDSNDVHKNCNEKQQNCMGNEPLSDQWQDSDQEDKSFCPFDEKRMKIIKDAISLTSQPPKQPTPRKSRRLRKSFLITLRRTSKVVWEEDLLSRFGPPDWKPSNRKSRKNGDVRGDDDDVISHVDSPKWRPSLTNNKIINDSSDESDDEQYLNDIIEKRGKPTKHSSDSDEIVSRASQISNPLDNTDLSSAKEYSNHQENPADDFDDPYYTESASPDIYSLVSDVTGSYTSESSYTTGSYTDDEDFGNSSEYYGFSDDI